MKEKKRKWKEAGTAKRFPLKFINEQKERSSLQCLSGAFIVKTPLQNTKKKKPKEKAITRDKLGRNKKM